MLPNKNHRRPNQNQSNSDQKTELKSKRKIGGTEVSFSNQPEKQQENTRTFITSNWTMERYLTPMSNTERSENSPMKKPCLPG